MLPVLHLDNKIEYPEGQRVQIALDGDIQNILSGTIVGKSISNVIDFFIVKLDKKLPHWQYSCITVQHTFIRPEGDNRPFLCEGISRA